MRHNTITPVQQRDTCLALAFLLLLIRLFVNEPVLVYAAMALLGLGMVAPAAMTPLARLWFGLSETLGKITSPLVLGVVYTLVLLPVALVRQLMGKDSLRLKHWKKSSGSCFVERNHTFGPDDFRNPY